MQLIASVTQLVSPLLGIFIDHYGAPKSAAFMASCLWIGLLLLVVASSFPSVFWDRVLFVANSFLAMAVWMGGQLTVQTGLYFAGHTKSRVIFLLNSLFDGGSITYLFLWWLSQTFSLSLTAVASGYFVCGVAVVGVGLYFWFAAVPELDEDKYMTYGDSKQEADPTEPPITNASDNEPSEENSQSVVEPSSHRFGAEDERHSAQGHTLEGEIVGNTGARSSAPLTPLDAPDDQTPNSGDLGDRRVSFHDTIVTRGVQANTSERIQESNKPDYILVADRTTKEQLLSTPYLLLCLFFSLHVTMNMWTLATMRDYLAYLGDDELDNRYLTIFTLLLPASIVSVPLVDVIVLRLGFAGGFQSINALALGYSIIRVASTNLNVQIGE